MREKNGQDLPGSQFGRQSGRLSVVSTPIGNLSDLSPRARKALETSAAILCEDTRQGAKLLNALGIPRPMSALERLDAHTPPGRLARFVDRMRQGEDLALVTDAGTPAVSDPGAALVALARGAGIVVVPVPGPSAVLALLAASGLEPSGFAFRGFFPRKDSERQEELERVAGSGLGGAYVWFESPQRVVEALQGIARLYPEARVVAAKELTKLHERFFSGSAIEAAQAVESEVEREGALGEWCFAIVFPELMRERDEESESWIKALECLIDAGVTVSESARRVADVFDQSKKKVYGVALTLEKKLHEKKSDEGG